MSVASRSSARALVAAAAACLVAAPAAHAAKYSVLDLGTYGGGPSRTAVGVDDSGRVAGTYFTDDGLFRGYRTAPNGAINAASNLGTLDNSDPSLASWANGISPTGGYVVGYSWYGIVESRPFRVDAAGTMTDLGTFGGIEGEARAVNAGGVAVGYSQTADGTPRAFRQSGTGAMAELGTLNGYTSSFANGLNANGLVVGYASKAGETPQSPDVTRAFRTRANATINTATDDLGTLGGASSTASGINAAGRVVGGSQVSRNTATHAYRTVALTKIQSTDDLGTLGGNDSSAAAINDLGQVVGWSEFDPDSDATHAFFADVTGPMIDLNTLIPADSGWVLEFATGINASGQISGIGTFDGEQRAFVLSIAVPEPTTLAALAGVAVVALRRRRA